MRKCWGGTPVLSKYSWNQVWATISYDYEFLPGGEYLLLDQSNRDQTLTAWDYRRGHNGNIPTVGVDDLRVYVTADVGDCPVPVDVVQVEFPAYLCVVDAFSSVFRNYHVGAAVFPREFLEKENLMTQQHSVKSSIWMGQDLLGGYQM